jgi:hypothetical protein
VSSRFGRDLFSPINFQVEDERRQFASVTARCFSGGILAIFMALFINYCGIDQGTPVSGFEKGRWGGEALTVR